ncbi:MAG: PAS domain S-box protein, partial [Nitrospinales bacterium]
MQREHALVLLNKDVAQAANEALTFDDAAQECLDRICNFTGWPVGHLYLCKKTSKETLAVPSTIWHLNDLERFKSFKEVTEATCFKLGEGLPGRVLSSGKPLWIRDVTRDSNFPRARLARDIAVKAAFGFPALRGKEVTAVLEFFSEDALEPDESLLAVMSHIGAALGRVIERQQAEAEIRASKNRFRNIFDYSNDMIFIIDPARDKILDINDKACSTLGYSREELLSLRMSDIHPSGLSKMINFVHSISAENGGKTDEFFCRTKIGAMIPVEISASLVDIAGTNCLLALVRDITERKRTEAELKQYAKDLEKTNATLQDFTFTASHDLQEPLRKIISFGDRLKALSGERLKGPELACVERIQGATFRMKQLIDDLLEYSRLSAKPAAFAPVDLNEIVEKAISDLEVTIKEDNGTVNVGNLPVLEADKLQMWQLFQNLISNGLKYSKPDEPPVISIKSVPLKNGFWEIHVEDNGIGFEEKHQDLIFKPFERLHPHGKFHGSGMGLAICGKIVDRHKGTIAAQGKLNQGALFVVTLPEKQRPVEGN